MVDQMSEGILLAIHLRIVTLMAVVVSTTAVHQSRFLILI